MDIKYETKGGMCNLKLIFSTHVYLYSGTRVLGKSPITSQSRQRHAAFCV